jgi:hypothetical protein
MASIFQTTWRHDREKHKIGISYDGKLLLSPRKALDVPVKEQSHNRIIKEVKKAEDVAVYVTRACSEVEM